MISDKYEHDETVPLWFYHPESDCYVRSTWAEMKNSAEADLLVELGAATTESESEAIALHQEIIINRYTK